MEISIVYTQGKNDHSQLPMFSVRPRVITAVAYPCDTANFLLQLILPGRTLITLIFL